MIRYFLQYKKEATTTHFERNQAFFTSCKRCSPTTMRADESLLFCSFSVGCNTHRTYSTSTAALCKEN